MRNSSCNPILGLGLIAASALAALAFAAAMLAGCDKPAGAPSPAEQRKISAIATVYPVAELVGRVGGSRVDIHWFSEGPLHPADIEQTPDLKQRLKDARLLVTSGPWDTWASIGLSADARNQMLIEPERLPASAAADPRAYLWLDPMVMKQIVESAQIHLTAIDPASDQDFRRNAAAALAEIAAVDAEITKALPARNFRKVLVVRPVWAAMLSRYGWTQIAPVDGPEQKLSADDFKALAAAAKNNGLKTIYLDASTPVAIRQQIEERTGLRALSLDATGTSAPAGRSTYIRLMRYNLEQLLTP